MVEAFGISWRVPPGINSIQQAIADFFDSLKVSVGGSRATSRTGLSFLYYKIKLLPYHSAWTTLLVSDRTHY